MTLSPRLTVGSRDSKKASPRGAKSPGAGPCRHAAAGGARSLFTSFSWKRGFAAAPPRRRCHGDNNPSTQQRGEDTSACQSILEALRFLSGPSQAPAGARLSVVVSGAFFDVPDDQGDGSDLRCRYSRIQADGRQELSLDKAARLPDLARFHPPKIPSCDRVLWSVLCGRRSWDEGKWRRAGQVRIDHGAARRDGVAVRAKSIALVSLGALRGRCS